VPGLENAGKIWGVASKGCRVSFQGDENILKQIMVMVAQLYGHTENYSEVHWKWMNPSSVEPS